MTRSQQKWQQAYAQFFSNIIRAHRLLEACGSHTAVDEQGQKNLDQAGDDIARSAMVSRSIAQQIISSRRAVATTAIFRLVLLPRQT